MSTGKIITFYSYKGGVGRTMALANIAVLLSQWGFKVLAIDWDLEAPGLHLYFRKLSELDSEQGLVEFIQAYATTRQAHWRDYLSTVQVPDALQPLTLLTAGRQDDSYERRMQTIKWDVLYAADSFGNFLEQIRDEWKAEFDFILIDSRTGISDIGGICTIQLPDELVLLLTANEQSLRGSLNVARKACEGRQRLGVERSLLRVLPIPTRFEGRFEYDVAQLWLSRFAQEFDALYADWRHSEVTPQDLLRFLRLPYVPKWSFDENLPVLDEGTKDPESISYAMETIAALLAQSLGGTDVLVRNRDSYVEVARRGPANSISASGQKRPIRIYYSYSREDEIFSRELDKHLTALRRQELIQRWDNRMWAPGETPERTFNAQIETADIILLLISADFLASDFTYSAEMKHAIERHARGQARVMPILLRPVDIQGTPLAKIQCLPRNGRPISLWPNQDAAWVDVVSKIRQVAVTLQNEWRQIASVDINPFIDMSRSSREHMLALPGSQVRNATEKKSVDANMIKVLFLGADPSDATRLHLPEERREIQRRMQYGSSSNRFQWEDAWALTAADLAQVLLRYKPQILHFSGHGLDKGEILLNDESGQPRSVPASALERLFKLFARQGLRCVVLNACYSEEQAHAIAQHIECVIGVSDEIIDNAALAFTSGFYAGLAQGDPVKTAFELGCVQLELMNFPEHEQPKLIGRPGVDLDTLRFQ